MLKPDIISSSPEELEQSWPYILYKGKDFFHSFYDAVGRIEFEFDFYQEVYLGYLKDLDYFIVGWDISDAEGLWSLIKIFKFDGSSLEEILHSREWDLGFYPKALIKLHELYPSLIDLRLD